MAVHLIPPSSNWYLSCISGTSCDREWFAYGANCSVVLVHMKEDRPKISMLHGHSLRVNSVFFLPCTEQSHWLVSCSQDRTVRLWNTHSGQCIAYHQKHNRSPICLSISPLDPTTILSAEEEGTIIAWKLPTISQISGSEGQQDLGHFQTISTSHFNIHSKITSIACSPGLKYQLAIGYQTGIILLVNWQQSTITHRLLGHTEFICTLSFSPPKFPHIIPNLHQEHINESDKVAQMEIEDEKSYNHYLVSGSKDKTIKYWNLISGRCLQTVSMPPTPGSGKGRKQKDSRQRYWLAVAWNPFNPLETICSSHGGEILLSKISFKAQETSNETIKPENQLELFQHATEEDFDTKKLKWIIKRLKSGSNGMQHSRTVFNISILHDSRFFTTSMDRQIGIWDLGNKKPLDMIHCPGGHVYGLDCTPLQPSCVAIAVGDQSILLWNPPRYKKDQKLHGELFDMKVIWRGIQSKVTAIKWHPVKDGTLAFGTDDGRIGSYDTLSGKYKLFSSKHKGIIYELQWRAYGIQKESINLIEDGNINETKHLLYSCGSDGIILVSDDNKPNAASKKFSSFLNTSKTLLQITCFSWNSTQNLIAIGQPNGSIVFLKSIYTTEDWKSEQFEWLHVAKLHEQEIRSLRFHPGSLIPEETINYKNWIASSSKSGDIGISDCAALFQENLKEIAAPASLTSWLLLGHKSCVTDLQWSPHNPNQLLSASYDGTIQLWDARFNYCEPIANFRGHCGRVFACCFSLLHSDIIYTASDDHTCRMWLISSSAETKPPVHSTSTSTSTKSKKKRKRRRTNKQQTGTANDLDNKTEIPPTTLMPLLAEKSGESITVTSPINKESLQVPSISSSNNTQKRISLFPSLNTANQTKETARNDCIDIARQIYGSQRCPKEPQTQKILEKEKTKFLNNEQPATAATLQMWQGHITSAMETVFQPLSDNRRATESEMNLFLALAPQCGFHLWKEFVRNYATMLETKGDLHQSVLCWITIGETTRAIQVYRDANLFNDALMLAKIQLGEEHSIVSEIYGELAAWYMKQQKVELAAQCFLHKKDIQSAVDCLKGKLYSNSDIQSLQAARELAELGSLSEEFTQLSLRIGLLMLANNDSQGAKDIFISAGSEFNFHVFTCGVKFALSSFPSANGPVCFAASRSKCKQQNESLNSNEFTTLFPKLSGESNEDVSQEIMFLKKLWSFFSDMDFLRDSTRLNIELNDTHKKLSNFYDERIGELQNQTKEQKQYLSLNLLCRSVICFCLSNLEGNETNDDYIALWLDAFVIQYRLNDLFAMRHFVENFQFSKTLQLSDSTEQPPYLLNNIRAFVVSLELSEWLNGSNIDKNFSEKKLERFEAILLPNCIIQLDSLSKRIEKVKEQVRALALQENLRDLSKKQIGKKRSKQESDYCFDSLSLPDEEPQDIQSLQIILQELQEEEENLQKKIGKFPFPFVEQSQRQLQQAHQKLINAQELQSNN